LRFYLLALFVHIPGAQGVFAGIALDRGLVVFQARLIQACALLQLIAGISMAVTTRAGLARVTCAAYDGRAQWRSERFLPHGHAKGDPVAWRCNSAHAFEEPMRPPPARAIVSHRQSKRRITRAGPSLPILLLLPGEVPL